MRGLRRHPSSPVTERSVSGPGVGAVCQHPIQRAPPDPEDLGRMGLVAAARGEHRAHVALLELLDGDELAGVVRFDDDARALVIADLGGQVVDADRRILRQRDGALDASSRARARCRASRSRGASGPPRRRCLRRPCRSARRCASTKRCASSRTSLASRAKRRHLDVDDVDAIEQIFAERAPRRPPPRGRDWWP